MHIHRQKERKKKHLNCNAENIPWMSLFVWSAQFSFRAHKNTCFWNYTNKFMNELILKSWFRMNICFEKKNTSKMEYEMQCLSKNKNPKTKLIASTRAEWILFILFIENSTGLFTTTCIRDRREKYLWLNK